MALFQENAPKKPVAVIILNWNGVKLLREFLPSVIRHTNSDIADVIVADNGSSDDSLLVLEREFPEALVLPLDKNYGYAEGYNRAIRATHYEYTILLNSDVEVTPHWVEPLYDYCSTHRTVAACQPKILAYTDKTQFEYAGAAGGFIDRLGYPYCRGRIFSTVECDHGQYDADMGIFWASGAGLFVRTEVYLQAGGLDRLFFAHMEEIDLCWRIHLLGYDIRYIHTSVIHHLGGGSLPAGNPRKTYLNFRNNLLLLYKNLPRRDRSRTLFVRRLYDTLAFFMFVAKLDFANARAVLQAHHDFRTMRKNYNPDATPITRNLLREHPGSRCNIVIDYYLRHRRTF